MSKPPIAFETHLNEGAVTERFLDHANEQSFENLFHVFSPRLVAYFRSRQCKTSEAEGSGGHADGIPQGLSNSRSQLFCAWLYKIARSALCRHYGKQTRELDIVNIGYMAGRLTIPQVARVSLAFEFPYWMRKEVRMNVPYRADANRRWSCPSNLLSHGVPD